MGIVSVVVSASLGIVLVVIVTVCCNVAICGRGPHSPPALVPHQTPVVIVGHRSEGCEIELMFYKNSIKGWHSYNVSPNIWTCVIAECVLEASRLFLAEQSHVFFERFSAAYTKRASQVRNMHHIQRNHRCPAIAVFHPLTRPRLM